MNKTETMELFGEEAKVAAQQICGCGECFGNYDCGHPNNISKRINMRKLSEDTTCPIAHYEVKPDTRPFHERLMAGEKPLDERGIFALCACCEHSNGVKEAGEDTVELDLDESAYEKHCMDCPVHMAYECMMENLAEAMMS